MNISEDDIIRQEYQIEPVTTDELERRWRIIREGMGREGLDVLITVSTPYALGHYPQYFTGFQPHGYQTTVIFPIDGEMILVAHHSPPKQFLRGVKEIHVAPQVVMFRNAWSADAVKTVEVLKAMRPSSIGLVGLGCMSAAFFEYLTKHFPKVETEKSTDIVDEARAVKSQEELRCVLKTAAMQDLTMEAAKTLIRPGRKVYEVMADLRHLIHLSGESADQAALIAGSITPGQDGVAFEGQPLWNHTVRNGEVFTWMNESAGPGGYYLETVRNFCVGFSPSKEFETGWNDIKEQQQRMVGMYKPGADPNEILEFARQFQMEKGFPGGEVARLIGHGQGLDYVERPALTPLGETMKLKAGMVVSCHPAMNVRGVNMTVNDSFLVTESGGKRLHKTPQEIFVV